MMRSASWTGLPSCDDGAVRALVSDHERHTRQAMPELVSPPGQYEPFAAPTHYLFEYARADFARVLG